MKTRNIDRGSRRVWVGALVAAGALAAAPASAQFPDVESPAECPGCSAAAPAPDAALAAFLGTWSTPATSRDDPAWAVEDFFCFTACTPGGREKIAALLGDSAHAPRSAVELFPEAAAANAADAAEVLVAPAVAAAVEPGAGGTRFACSPDGFAPLVVSALPLAIVLESGRVVLRYEEFGARRAIAFGGGHDRGAAGPAAFGASAARIENGALVVRTSGIPRGRIYSAFGSREHGDRLTAVERYRVSGDGQWLDLTLELSDPDTLRAPLVLVKRWRRAEHETLRSHGCDALAAGLEGVVFEYLDPARIDARRASTGAATGLQPPGLVSRFASASTRAAPASAASDTRPAAASTFTSAASDSVPSPAPLPLK
ncbi:MAG TPA: hypothetical protein VFX89_10675 [Gammaproteobacteria bacterium]|nr:hypothetical protein [Gammaproteobacteria bacterium]